MKRKTNRQLLEEALRELRALKKRVSALERVSHEQGVLATPEELERRLLEEAEKNWEPGTSTPPFQHPQYPSAVPEPNPFGPKIYCTAGRNGLIC